jgi:hypothetical protein
MLYIIYIKINLKLKFIYFLFIENIFSEYINKNMLQNLTVVELREKCKKKGFKGYSNKCKKDLLHLLQKKKNPMKGGGNIDFPGHFWKSPDRIIDETRMEILFSFIPDEWASIDEDDISKGATFNYKRNEYKIVRVNRVEIDGFEQLEVEAERI